jgi:hypothetical protein
MSRSWTFGLALLALSGLTSPAFAQASNAPTAHVAYVDGRVIVEHDTTAEDGIGDTPLSPGDRVRTEAGRAEILTEDGSVIDLDEDTTIDLQSDGLFRLMAGRVVVVSSGSTALQVDTPAAAVFINEPGEYRIGLVDDQGRLTLDLGVVRGQAEIASDVERLTVQTGQRAWARAGEAPSYPVEFNSAQSDAFYDWAADRADSRRGTTASAQYVPASLTQYAGTFDNYGSWNYEPTYGYVWYPRVAVGWRPYYAGRWRHYGGWGWTWTGGDPWAWPTHHYGRWGVSSAGLWFWIPGTVWAGAWVDWQFSSSYVSWCPLGYNNYPVYGWYGGYYGHGHGHGHHGHYDDHWRGWTVVHRDHFGGYRSVSRVAVDGRRFAVNRSNAGSFAHGAPPRPVAVPRGSGPDGFFADRGHSGFTQGNRGGVGVARSGVGVARSGVGVARSGVAVPRTGFAADRNGAVGDRNGYAANRGAMAPNGARAVPRGGTMTLGDRVYHVPPAVGEDARARTATGTDRAGGSSAARGYATQRTDPTSRTFGPGTYSGFGRIAPGGATAVQRGQSGTLPDQRVDRSTAPVYQRQPGATYGRSGQPGYQRQPMPPTNDQRTAVPRQTPSSYDRAPAQRQGSPALQGGRTQSYQRTPSATFERSPQPSYQRQATPSYQRTPSQSYQRGPGATYERSPQPGYQRQAPPAYQRAPQSYQRTPGATFERSPQPSYQRQAAPSFQRSAPTPGYQRAPSATYQRSPTPNFQRQASPSFQRQPSPSFDRGRSMPSYQAPSRSFQSPPSFQRQAPSAAPQARGGGGGGRGGAAPSRGGSAPRGGGSGGGGGHHRR